MELECKCRTRGLVWERAHNNSPSPESEWAPEHKLSTPVPGREEEPSSPMLDWVSVLELKFRVAQPAWAQVRESSIPARATGCMFLTRPPASVREPGFPWPRSAMARAWAPAPEFPMGVLAWGLPVLRIEFRAHRSPMAPALGSPSPESALVLA